MKLPNRITLFRLLIPVVFMPIVMADFPGAKAIAFGLFILATFSDWLDGYIARKYDLIQFSVYGLNPDSLPSPKKLVETIQIAQEQGVKAIYYEALLSGEMAQMIADEVGCTILPLNPGANLSRKELQSGMSFFDIMKRNLENLKIGLIYK